MDYWKPNATVAAVVEQDGRFLMVEETTREGLRLNQPSGHLDPGETLAQAVVREALEETAHHVEPTACVGVYMSRYRYEPTDTDVTYLRFAFAGEVLGFDETRDLDDGIVRAVWMTPAEIEACADRHRSPFVVQCVNDWLAGRRFPLDLIRHYA